jgi:GNAT superfamily N-acetyltransferase
MDDLTLTVGEEAAPEDAAQVHRGLDEFNRARVGDDNVRHLSVLVRDADGTVVAGALGVTYWGWLYIGTLWVDERLRGQGWGSKVMDAAEAEARRRGCHHAHLDTMSFQALPFYLGRGYTVYGELDDKPLGHSQYFLQKAL